MQGMPAKPYESVYQKVSGKPVEQYDDFLARKAAEQPSIIRNAGEINEAAQKVINDPTLVLPESSPAKRTPLLRMPFNQSPVQQRGQFVPPESRNQPRGQQGQTIGHQRLPIAPNIPQGQPPAPLQPPNVQPQGQQPPVQPQGQQPNVQQQQPAQNQPAQNGHNVNPNPENSTNPSLKETFWKVVRVVAPIVLVIVGVALLGAAVASLGSGIGAGAFAPLLLLGLASLSLGLALPGIMEGYDLGLTREEIDNKRQKQKLQVLDNLNDCNNEYTKILLPRKEKLEKQIATAEKGSDKEKLEKEFNNNEDEIQANRQKEQDLQNQLNSFKGQGPEKSKPYEPKKKVIQSEGQPPMPSEDVESSEESSLDDSSTASEVGPPINPRNSVESWESSDEDSDIDANNANPEEESLPEVKPPDTRGLAALFAGASTGAEQQLQEPNQRGMGMGHIKSRDIGAADVNRVDQSKTELANKINDLKLRVANEYSRIEGLAKNGDVRGDKIFDADLANFIKNLDEKVIDGLQDEYLQEVYLNALIVANAPGGKNKERVPITTMGDFIHLLKEALDKVH